MSGLTLTQQRTIGLGLLALLALMLLVVAFLEWREGRATRPPKRGWRRGKFPCGDPGCPMCTGQRVTLQQSIDYIETRNDRIRGRY